MNGLRQGTEDEATRHKRLRMRSWRRGMREMDLILGPFADARLVALAEEDLAAYDRLLSEADGDLTAWILGRSAPPDWATGLIESIAAFAREQHSPR